jgi:hypothetical protein
LSEQSRVLESLTERAESEDITVLPLPERCRLIREFSDALIATACNPAPVRDDQDLENVDEEKFEREVRVLKRLACTLSYSEIFNSWMRQRKPSLLERLSQKNPAYRLCNEWERANESQRRGLVMKIVNQQCDVFSEDLGLTITPPNIRWLVGGRKKVIGTVDFFDYDNLKRQTSPGIKVRQHLFAEPDPDEAITVAQHEALHCTLFVLAMRAFSGKINKRHPLHHDAQMELEKIKAGAIISSRIYSAYRAQPEERLCFGLQETMQNKWLTPE